MNGSFMKKDSKSAGERTGRRAFIGLCFLFGFVILFLRFGYLQVLQAETMKLKARQQYE